MNRAYRHLFLFAASAILFVYAFLPMGADAHQGSLSVTVTPPLFQLTIGPGESWASTLKIVNNNPYDVTYYATPVDFEADGESGRGRFMPLIDAAGEEQYTLGGWIDISNDPIVVPGGRSIDVPFTVSVPEHAAPGGHYAAILVGTKSEGQDMQGSALNVSSYVSSLLFVRIKGEVIEKGRIREFTSAHSLYQAPAADFALRFENIGTTHLKPQGDVTLYNMWGKERGKVEINSQKSSFGNVLPGSTRKFEFSWEGERSPLDIGRYSAVVTLAYGEDQKQNATATTYFWVVPIVPVASVLGSFVLFLFLLIWFIRRYIRRTLALERGYAGVTERPAPVRYESRHSSIFGFLQHYALLFFFLALLTAASLAVWTYFDNVLAPQRAFEITNVSSGEESSEGNE